MPTTLSRNLLYRAALPLFAPSPRGQMEHSFSGLPLNDLHGYERILRKHHVLGSSLMLTDGESTARVDTSIAQPMHTASPDTLYRVASITKMATALTALTMIRDGLFALDTPVQTLLPNSSREEALKDVTVRHLLSHTSGLQDIPAVDQALANGHTWHDVLQSADIRFAAPGASFRYCNFGFGLMGCVMEAVTGQPIPVLYSERLFSPLGMHAFMDASALDPQRIMPISRVLRYHPGQDVVITKLGRIPLTTADPEHHFGHTAGAMYTDSPSLSKLLSLVAAEESTLLPASLLQEMRSRQASYGAISPGMSYGLGLVIIEDPQLSPHRILGHQGYAYGCADGAFWEETTGRQVIFLNGGCSEARTGRLGLCNHQLLQWALGKEIPSWQSSKK